MCSWKLILLVALQLFLEGSCDLCQVSQSCGQIIPAGSFVIPAVIKPIFQAEAAPPAPVCPDYSGYGGFPGFCGPPGFPGPMPYGGMPPIIFDDSDDDRSSHWIYWLILALSRRFGGFGGYNGYGGGFGGCGGCCGGCGGGCGSCGGGYGGCNNGFGNFNNGCGGNGFFGGNIPNGCNGGSNCVYVPYPVPVPCGGTQGGGGYPTFDGPIDECSPFGTSPNEINIIVRTDPSCACT